MMVIKPERKDISKSASSAGNLRLRLSRVQFGGRLLAGLLSAARLLQQLHPSLEFSRLAHSPNRRQWPLRDAHVEHRAILPSGPHPYSPAPDTSFLFRESPAQVRAR